MTYRKVRMKRIICISVLLLCSQFAFAADVYVFRADEADDSLVGREIIQTSLTDLSWEGWAINPSSKVREWKKHYIFTVTQSEYNAGWAALAQSKNDSGKTAAATDKSDFEKV